MLSKKTNFMNFSFHFSPGVVNCLLQFFPAAKIVQKTLIQPTFNKKNMEILLTVKKYSTIIGFQPFNHPKSQWICSTLRGFALFVLLASSVLTLWYFVFDTDTFIEQAKSFSLVNMVIYCTLNCCILLWRWDKLEQNMENLTEMIRERPFSHTHIFIHNSKGVFVVIVVVNFLLELQAILA